MSSDATPPDRDGWTEWVLLDADRRSVAGITAVGCWLALSAVTVSGLAPLSDLQAVFYVLGALISGNLTLVTVVVSINQLLLSRELQTPPELRAQIDGVIAYRTRVEETAGRVAPVEPLGFLRLLIEVTRQEAQRLGGLARTEAGDGSADRLIEIGTEITAQIDRIDALLQQSGTATFDVLAVTLSTNYAREINRLRRVKADSSEPDDVTDTIDTLVEQLQRIDIARQYFKSIYFQQELAQLSRWLFYAGLPSVTVVAATLVVLTVPDASVRSGAALTLLVPAIVTIGLLPLSVLFAYVLRIATVTQRTAAILPFTTPSQER